MHLPKALASWHCRERLPKFPQCDHQHLQIRKPKLHTLPWNSLLRDMNILQPKQASPYSGMGQPWQQQPCEPGRGLTKGGVVQDMESWSQKSSSLKQWARFSQCHRPFLWNFIFQIETWTIWLKIEIKIIPLKHTKATFLFNFKWSERRKLKSLSLLSGCPG